LTSLPIKSNRLTPFAFKAVLIVACDLDENVRTYIQGIPALEEKEKIV
jgi:hypothetical protein